MRMRVLITKLRVENEMRVFLESLNFEIEMRVLQKSAIWHLPDNLLDGDQSGISNGLCFCCFAFLWSIV